MRRWLIVLAMFAMFALVAPLAAVPEPTADELLANRRRYELLKKHPEEVAKVRSDAAAFEALPKERRKQIVQIHKELHKEPAAAQARLENVLDRYSDWLADLEKSDKATWTKITTAADAGARLALIKQAREQEWIRDQPKAIREKLGGLNDDERKNLIAKLKQEERQRRFEWTMATRFWTELDETKGRRPLPTKLAELPGSVKTYVENYLQKMFLTQDEKDQLAKLEGHWPQYPMKLVELADKHPAALPGALGPKSFGELPPRVIAALANKAPNPKKTKEAIEKPALLIKFLRVPEVEWPKFGVELAKTAKIHSIVFDHEFLAYSVDCLEKPMKDFLKYKLEPVLDAKETYRLANAIGKWPDYPQAIQDLANNHHLRAPWQILPTPPGEDWNKYRWHKVVDR